MTAPLNTTELGKLLAETRARANASDCLPWVFVPEKTTNWGNVRCACGCTIFRAHRIDVELIIASVNALPALLDRIDLLEEVAESAPKLVLKRATRANSEFRATHFRREKP